MNVLGMLVRSIAAGFAATCVLSVLILAKKWLPPLDTIRVMDGIAHDLALAAGLPAPYAGWLWHFIVGSAFWGWTYAVMEPIIPGRRPWRKGLSFGLFATLLVWLMVLPLAGAGLFGMYLNAAQPLVTLIEHLVYGVMLGVVYDRLAYPGVTK